MTTKTVLHVFSTFAVGGPQVRFAKIVNELPHAFRHVVVALDGNVEAKSKINSEVNCEFIQVENMKALPLGKRLLAIRKVIKQQSPDVLMTYNWGAIEWVLVNNWFNITESLHWEDGFGPEEKSKLLTKRNWFRRLAFLNKSKVLVPSQNLYRLAQQHWKVSSNRLQYFPNGIDLPEQPMAKTRSEQVAFGTLATLRAEKNIKRLIDAFANCPSSSKLIIGGDGPELTALQAYAQNTDLGSRVEFSGRVDDIWGFMSQLDVFCLSSDTEQMPISVLEAMACRLPIVATDVGDVKQMLSQQNSEFVVSPDVFAKTMAQLGDNRELWQPLGEGNFDKVQKEYSMAAMLNNFCQLIEK